MGIVDAKNIVWLSGWLEVERMSAQQLFLFDQAPKGKKPKFLKAHGGLEAIVTAVKWTAGLVGRNFTTQKRIDDRVAALEQRTSVNADAIIVREFAKVREDITTLTISVDSLRKTVDKVNEQLRAIGRETPSQVLPPLDDELAASNAASEPLHERQTQYNPATYKLPKRMTTMHALNLYFLGCTCVVVQCVLFHYSCPAVQLPIHCPSVFFFFHIFHLFLLCLLSVLRTEKYYFLLDDDRNSSTPTPPLRTQVLFDRRSQQRHSQIRIVAKFVKKAFGRSIKTRQHIVAAIRCGNKALHEETETYHRHFESILNINLSPVNHTNGHMKLRTFYNKICDLKRFRKTHGQGLSADWIRNRHKEPRAAAATFQAPSVSMHAMSSAAVDVDEAAVLADRVSNQPSNATRYAIANSGGRQSQQRLPPI